MLTNAWTLFVANLQLLICYKTRYYRAGWKSSNSDGSYTIYYFK